MEDAIKKADEEIEIMKKEQYADTLYNPAFLERINQELDKKIEGEHQARKTIFLVFNMRNVKNLNKATDNLMINDEGGTGKDYVVDAVFEILPEEEKTKKNRITPKLLSYAKGVKIDGLSSWIKQDLYLEDVPNYVLNDDAFKVMCSADPKGKNEISIVDHNKEKNFYIIGKPSIVITIASANPKQELLRRFPILNLTSTEPQTRAVFRKQARFSEDGISSEYSSSVKKAIANLKQISVKIPYATAIAEVFPSKNVIARTHFTRFLDYIKSSCALYQYQREKNEEGYYFALGQDYDIARMMLQQTTSNILMIPQTKKQKQILEKFRKLPNDKYSFQDLEKEMQNIAGSRWLRTQLEKLVEQGFLKRNNETRDGSIKPIAVYSYKDIGNFILPTFEELKNSANKTTNTNNTNNTNSANKEKNNSSSNLHNLNYLHSDLQNQIFHKCVVCGSNPCHSFNDKGQPVCDEHSIKIESEVLKDSA